MIEDIKRKKEEFKHRAVSKDEVYYPGKDNIENKGGIKDRVNDLMRHHSA